MVQYDDPTVREFVTGLDCWCSNILYAISCDDADVARNATKMTGFDQGINSTTWTNRSGEGNFGDYRQEASFGDWGYSMREYDDTEIVTYRGGKLGFKSDTYRQGEFVQFAVEFSIIGGHSADEKRDTALHLALRRSAHKVARVLIDAGADINRCNTDGQAPNDMVDCSTVGMPQQQVSAEQVAAKTELKAANNVSLMEAALEKDLLRVVTSVSGMAVELITEQGTITLQICNREDDVYNSIRGAVGHNLIQVVYGDVNIPEGTSWAENGLGEGERLMVHLKEGEDVVFVNVHGGCGLSARDVGVDCQLNNNKQNQDRFTMCEVAEDIFTFESHANPGTFIGIGSESWGGFQAVLVGGGMDDQRKLLRTVPARNGAAAPWCSYEHVDHPGYLLNHCNGMLWFFNAPKNNETCFGMDATWDAQVS